MGFLDLKPPALSRRMKVLIEMCLMFHLARSILADERRLRRASLIRNRSVRRVVLRGRPLLGKSFTCNENENVCVMGIDMVLKKSAGRKSWTIYKDMHHIGLQYSNNDLCIF